MISTFKTFGMLMEDRVQWLKDNVPEVKSDHDALAAHRDKDAIIDHWASADPHPKKAYTQWAVNRYSKGDFRQEDAPRVTTALSNFDRYKGKLENKDINHYKSLSDLEDATEPHVGGAASNKEAKRAVKDEGADKIHDDGKGLTVHTLKTHEAACAYGAGTKWCTASKNDSHMFDHYNKMGPIHVVQTPDDRKYQFHFNSNQFMDEKDQPVKLEDLTKKHPGLHDVEAFKGQHPHFDTEEGLIHKATTGQKYPGGKDPVELDADAKKPKLAADHLEKAYAHGSDVYALASHPNTPSKVLSAIAGNAPSSGLASRIGSHPNIDDETVTHLINNHAKQYGFLHSLASNPAIKDKHVDQMTRAAGPSDHDLHEGLAKNPSISPERLKGYVAGKNHQAAINALHNPSTPHDAHEKAVEAPHLRAAVASSPHAPDHVLHRLVAERNAAGEGDHVARVAGDIAEKNLASRIKKGKK